MSNEAMTREEFDSIALGIVRAAMQLPDFDSQTALAMTARLSEGLEEVPLPSNVKDAPCISRGMRLVP